MFILHLGTWIEKSLTAMGEVYKQRLQVISFLVGLMLAVGLNLDTVRLVDHLWRNKETGSALAAIGSDAVKEITEEQMRRCTAGRAGGGASATAGAEAQPTPPECANVDRLMALVAKQAEGSMKLPIGWEGTDMIVQQVLSALSLVTFVAWTLTALAISLGASFWFDSLKRLVNLRSGMRKPES